MDLLTWKKNKRMAKKARTTIRQPTARATSWARGGMKMAEKLACRFCHLVFLVVAEERFPWPGMCLFPLLRRHSPTRTGDLSAAALVPLPELVVLGRSGRA